MGCFVLCFCLPKLLLSGRIRNEMINVSEDLIFFFDFFGLFGKNKIGFWHFVSCSPLRGLDLVF
jgi:hypothetical protein